MAVFSGSGSKIYISSTLPATYTKAGYTALTWTLIGDCTNIGEYGRDYNVIDYTPMDTRVTQKIKGNYSMGSLSLNLGSVPADAGQVLLLTASTSDNNYSFKIEKTDGDIDAFTGMVTSFKPNIQNGAILSKSVAIALNTDVVNIK